VADADGRLIASVGDPELVTYSRSSLKPFQALPTIARGAVERFGFNAKNIAVMCGSHNGEKRHVQAVAEILAAIGCDESDINCGVHEPYIYRMTGKQPPPGKKFSQLHNNCSGKHGGMLALCRLLDAPVVGYLEFDHPAQAEIRRVVLEVTELPENELHWGIDGCSLPNYTLPINVLARAFARLAIHRGPDDVSSRAMATIVGAMRTEPAMVSGIGRYDLALAETAGDRLICKVGGEAIECVALTDRGWGVTVKVADGGMRALGVATTAILRQLDVLTATEVDQLQPFAEPFLTNHRKIIAGRIRPAVRLK
jgi:L-asparaginase II